MVYKGFSILPTFIIECEENGNEWKENVLEFAQFYKDDLPLFFGLSTELDLYALFWKLNSKEKLPSTACETLRRIDFSGYTNIKVLLKILATIPVTSCTCERCISSLRLLKGYTRSTMTNVRLNGLALMYVHRELSVDSERVISAFAGPGKRRLIKDFSYFVVVLLF